MSEYRVDDGTALHRVHEGGVVKVAGVYLDHGCPVPGHLTEAFDRLIWSGLVTVAEGDPIWSVRQLSFTDPGQARYAVLGEQRQHSQRDAPAPGFGSPTPAGCRSPLAPPGSRPDRRSGSHRD